MEKAKVAVIGCGSVSSVHFDAIDRSEQVELVAACDTRRERAEEKAAAHNTAAYTDYRDVLDLDIDAVHICTPHYTHAPIALAAMEKGIHVLTEKPMATSLKDADAMIEGAQKHGVQLGVIFQNRYNASSIAVKELVDAGGLGTIQGCRVIVNWYRSDEYYIHSDWRGRWDTEGGGVLINQSIHTIDLMQWIMGEVSTIDASIHNRAHPSIEVEDVAEARISFANGAVGCLYAATYCSYDADILLEIHGDLGVARVEKDVARIHRQGEPEKVVSEDGSSQGLGKAYWGTSHGTQIEQFYSALRGNAALDIDGRAGRSALEIVRGIYYSGDQGVEVHFPFQEPEVFSPQPLKV